MFQIFQFYLARLYHLNDEDLQIQSISQHIKILRLGTFSGYMLCDSFLFILTGDFLTQTFLIVYIVELNAVSGPHSVIEY